MMRVTIMTAGTAATEREGINTGLSWPVREATFPPGMTTIWIDGKYFDRDTAMVSVFDHGLLYGDGVFEGIRAYNGRIFRLDAHMDRLYASAKGICLDIPMSKPDLGEVVSAAYAKSGMRDAYLRLVVTRGVGDLGLDPRKCSTPTIICIVDTIRLWPADRYERGLVCLTAATPISHRESLSPRIKSLNYLSHILAKIEGIAANVDEVIMLDSTGYVAEASGMNLFAVSDHTLKTPPPYTGILRGVTRDAIIELGRDAGFAVEELPLNRYDLYTADEVFLSGTAAEVIGVSKLDGRSIGAGCSGPVTKDLGVRFRALANRHD
jgi:branched-chain amino acid aminotransferase